MINPYNLLRHQGVSGARGIELPNNYNFELTMATWWSAVNRARLYSDFTGLDALYSYVMKSSTFIRAAVDKRLNPLKSRTFGVLVNGKEDVKLTDLFNASALVRELIYQKGLSNFTYARVVGVTKEMEPYYYPMRNLDVVNRAVKGETYDTEGKWKVANHVNLFWLQSDYNSEDTLGLLEPICRDYINACNAQNNWQTASQMLAYQQMMMYFENGDEKMQQAAEQAAAQVGLGTVIVSGKTSDENTGKVIKDLELENVYGSGAADTFRIFKENLDSLYENIGLVILGSSLLLKSAKNTNSERLVRAHLKGFYDTCEVDAIGVQDWLNKKEVKLKLSILLHIPQLENAVLKVKPSNSIDLGDIETYVAMLTDLELIPTDTFIQKTGLDPKDVVGYENAEKAGIGSEANKRVLEKRYAPAGGSGVVGNLAKRVFGTKGAGNGKAVA